MEKLDDLSIPQTKYIADRATQIRDEELREISAYKKEPFTVGDINAVLKAINYGVIEENSGGSYES